MIECRAPRTKKEFEQYYYLRWQVLRAPWSQELGSEQDDIEQQAIHRCIIDQEQNIIAVGRLHFVEQHKAQIRYMAVSDEARGKNLGSQMLACLEKIAKKRGASSIELNAREVALGFYQQKGYQVTEKSHLLYEDIQHYLMVKSLSGLTEHNSELCQQLQNTWHQTIPLSKAMNISISYFDGQELFTGCDPVFNKNLHNTMFAGSIYTLATLTGWGWVYLLLKKYQCGGDIVLADAKIKYLAPIKGVVNAKTKRSFVEGDTKLLQKNEKTRFIIIVEVYSGDKVAAKFTGEYVVIHKKDNND